MASTSLGTEDNKNEGNEFENWKSSMFAMFASVDDREFHARSISIVPDHLRKSNEDAYTPKVISIGPIHRRSKRDLIYMEEIKWLYMVSLLHRTDPGQMLNECSEAMYGMDEVVRGSYVDDLKSIDRYELAKIMLLDGCFLLELLIGNNVDLSHELPSKAASSPAPLDKRKKEEICSDLMVLENQIPQFVLYRLCATLFPRDFAGRDGKKRINDLVLSFFGYDTPGPSSIASDAAHILELLHSFVTGKSGLGAPLEETIRDPFSSSRRELLGTNVKKSTSKTGKSRHEKKQLRGCATKLQASGVTINSLRNTPPAEGAGFYFDIEFNEGILDIPQLHITTTTQDKWMNFIAWEQNITNREEVRGRSSMISCKFSCYALFLQGLICCEHDIELLRERNVIVVHDDGNSTILDKKKSEVMSNRDLMLLVNYIAEEVGHGNVDMIINSRFRQLFEELNSHESTANLFLGMFKVFWHYFRCLLTSLGYKCKKSYEILKVEYTPTVWKQIGIAYAVVLLGLTIAQVALQAISL